MRYVLLFVITAGLVGLVAYGLISAPKEDRRRPFSVTFVPQRPSSPLLSDLPQPALALTPSTATDASAASIAELKAMQIPELPQLDGAIQHQQALSLVAEMHTFLASVPSTGHAAWSSATSAASPSFQQQLHALQQRQQELQNRFDRLKTSRDQQRKEVLP